MRDLVRLLGSGFILNIDNWKSKKKIIINNDTWGIRHNRNLNKGKSKSRNRVGASQGLSNKMRVVFMIKQVT